MTIEPSEADVVLRIFREFADGKAIKRLVKELNAEEVRGRGTRVVHYIDWSRSASLSSGRCSKERPPSGP